MTPLIIIVAVGLFVTSMLAFAASMLMPTEETTATEDRLTALATGRRAGSEEDASSKSLLTGDLEGAVSTVDKFLERIPAVSQILVQADVNLTSTQLLGMCGGAFALGIVICVLTPVPALLGPILGLLLMGGPIGYVLWMRKRRLAKFGTQMPPALELLARSLRAGHSLNAGFGLVGSEMQAPLATEFQRCYEEQKFGIPIEEAIEDMADRVPNMDVRFFATAVLLQRQTGGDLSEILDKIGHLVRERLQIQGTIQALTGEGRMSGAVLLGLPPVLFIAMLKLNYDYVIQLFTDELGQYMMGMALVTQLLGAICIKKIITIKV